MKVCPKDVAHIMHMPKAKFCHHCGSELQEQPDKLCECGQTLTAGQKFCDICGKKAA
jgi:hypothetical protein